MPRHRWHAEVPGWDTTCKKRKREPKESQWAVLATFKNPVVGIGRISSTTGSKSGCTAVQPDPADGRGLHSDLTHDASPAKSCARARNCRAGFRFCLKEMVAMPVLGNGV